jgi:hypothetical protein
MMRMQSVRKRLQVLEALPQAQPKPGPLEQINLLALRQIPHADLELLIVITRARYTGVGRTLVPSELAALASHDAARETEARPLGFKSVADAQARAGRRP